MGNNSLLLSLLLACVIAIATATSTSVNFENVEIVPEVVSAAPANLLTVKYSAIEVNLGTELTPTQVKAAPQVSFEGSPDKFYTLVLVDPDAPSRLTPTHRSFLHWAMVNIPGTDVSQGESLVPYIGAGPPKGAGLHRYVFVLYEQLKGRTKFDEPGLIVDYSRPELLARFSVDKFAAKYHLGQPFAGNFFQAQSEDVSKVV